MPSRDRVRKKAEKGLKRAQRGGAKQARRINFQNEPWYAEAARRISAVRRSSEAALAQMPSPPLASE